MDRIFTSCSKASNNNSIAFFALFFYLQRFPMARFSRDFAHPQYIFNNCSNGKTLLFKWLKYFFRSAKEKSKGIPDVWVIGKAFPMKQRKFQNICSGGEKMFGKIFKKISRMDFQTKISEKSFHWKTPLEFIFNSFETIFFAVI